MFGDYPHVVKFVFGQTNHAGAQQTRVHVEHGLLVGLPIDYTAACCRTMPDQSAAILHDTSGAGHSCHLSLDNGYLHIGNLAIYRVDERVELRVTYHQPALLGPAGLGHEVLGQRRVMRIE